MIKSNLLLVFGVLAPLALASTHTMTAKDFEKQMAEQFEEQYGKLEDYIVNKYQGLCNACVLDDKLLTRKGGKHEAVYAVNSPYCSFTFEKEQWNFGEQLEKNNCLKEDPRKEDGITCKSIVGDSPLTCAKQCYQNRGEKAIEGLDLGQEFDLRTDHRCNFETKYWDPAQVATEGGVGITFVDGQSKKNLRFFLSDKPIGNMAGGIQPNRYDYGKYQVDVTKPDFRLKNGQNLMVICMGINHCSFRLGGNAKPPPPPPVVVKPKVKPVVVTPTKPGTTTPVTKPPTTTPEKKEEKLEAVVPAPVVDPAAKSDAQAEAEFPVVIIFAAIGGVVVIVIIILIVYFVRKTKVQKLKAALRKEAKEEGSEDDAKSPEAGPFKVGPTDQEDLQPYKDGEKIPGEEPAKNNATGVGNSSRPEIEEPDQTIVQGNKNTLLDQSDNQTLQQNPSGLNIPTEHQVRDTEP